MTVDGSSFEWMISSHAITVFPCFATMPCARSMKAAYCAGVIFFTSSPPMCRYGPGVIAASSPSTSSRNLKVISLSKQKLLKPTSMPVYSGGATPLQFSSGYEACAALLWLGMSISGMTRMNRSRA